MSTLETTPPLTMPVGRGGLGHSVGTDDGRQSTGSQSALQGGVSEACSCALAYAARGWHVFPVKSAPAKTPHTQHGHDEATTDEAKIVTWWRKWPSAQIGIACGPSGIVVVDLDVSAEKNGVEKWNVLKGFDSEDCSLIATTPRKGRHLVYRVPEGMRFTNGTDVVEKDSGIDVRAAGGYIIAPSPASPDRGYEKNSEGNFLETSPSDLTEPPPWVQMILPTENGSRLFGGSRRDGVRESARPVPLDAAEVRKIRSALAYIPNDDRKDWIRVGFALKSTGAQGQAFEIWDRWSRQHASDLTHPKYNERDQVVQWRCAREFRFDGTEITLGTLFHMAKANGWKDPDEGKEIVLEFGDAPTAPAIPTADTPSSTTSDTPTKPLGDGEDDGDAVEKISVMSWEEVAELPPIEWQVEGWIPEQSLAVVAGEPRAGKSFVLLDLALRMVHGMPFLGAPTEPCSTIYMAGEGHAGLAGRINAWRSQNDVTAADREGRYMAILDGIPTLSVENAKQVRKVVRETAKHYGSDPGLVIVDTLSQALDGGDENDAKSIAPALRILSGIRKRHHCTVVAVHHLAKPKPGATAIVDLQALRGSGALGGNSDTVIGVQRNGDDRSLICLKQKDGEDGGRIGFRLLPVETGRQRREGEPERSCIVVPALLAPIADPIELQERKMAAESEVAVAKVIEILRSIGGSCTSRETVYARMPGKTSKKRAAFDLAVTRGEIVPTGAKSRPTYELAERVRVCSPYPSGGGEDAPPSGDGERLTPPPRKKKGRGRVRGEGEENSAERGAA